MKLSITPRIQITDPMWGKIIPMIRYVWPSKAPIDNMQEEIIHWKAPPLFEFDMIILVEKHNEIIGFARAFTRDVKINGIVRKNMALGMVCVKKEFRGYGLGREIVETAFAFVKKYDFEFTIFQTKVPSFYEHLGAGILPNKIIDSLHNNSKVFWDPYVMVYPGYVHLGDSEIDLMGYGY